MISELDHPFGDQGLGDQKASFQSVSFVACDTIVALAGWAPPADPAVDGDEKSLQTHEEPTSPPGNGV